MLLARTSCAGLVLLVDRALKLASMLKYEPPASVALIGRSP
jgi:hypothetical protein